MIDIREHGGSFGGGGKRKNIPTAKTSFYYVSPFISVPSGAAAHFINSSLPNGHFFSSGNASTTTTHQLSFRNERGVGIGSYNITFVSAPQQSAPKVATTDEQGNYYIIENARVHKINKNLASHTSLTTTNIGFPVFAWFKDELIYILYSNNAIRCINYETSTIIYTVNGPSFTYTSYATRQAHMDGNYIYIKSGDTNGPIVRIRWDTISSSVFEFASGSSFFAQGLAVGENELYLNDTGNNLFRVYSKSTLGQIRTTSINGGADNLIYDKVSKNLLILYSNAIRFHDVSNNDVFIASTGFNGIGSISLSAINIKEQNIIGSPNIYYSKLDLI
ncbi:hypothetical protein ACJ2A9_21230 [Anaerobacillus sp. MEB173]|uniref:hypothetical protein n=1 Tax=Anaerobacillus sp. MEB173 TaxID=3383345 RepID=UPI003F918B6A